MNTPAHLIFGAAAFGRPGRKYVTTVAVLGSLAPDISLYVMAGWAIFIAGIDPGVVFGQMYFSDWWQGVFALDNSFVLWGVLLGWSVWAHRPLAKVFALAGLMHLAFDFALHNDDARVMFWPLSDWGFRSPFSYWDVRHFGLIIGPVELGVVIVLAILLWRSYRKLWSRGLIALAVVAELMTSGLFGMLFSH